MINLRERKFKILLSVLAAIGLLVIVFFVSFGGYLQERMFISKYSQEKDFWFVYESIKENREFIKKNPKNNIAYYSLGQGYYGLKAYDEAIDALMKAAKITPNNADYWLFLARVYQAKKDYSKAKGSYFEVLRINPDAPQTYIQLAWLYYFRLDTEKDKAFEVLKSGLQRFPEDKDILFDITRFYLYDENKEEFLKFAPRYLKLDTENATIKPKYLEWKK